MMSLPGAGLGVQRPHKTVYPTALPSYLPLKVISEMVEYFEANMYRDFLEVLRTARFHKTDT